MVEIMEDLKKVTQFFLLNNASRLNRRVNVIEKEELYRSPLFFRLNIWKFPVDCNNFTGMHFTVRMICIFKPSDVGWADSGEISHGPIHMLKSSPRPSWGAYQIL